MSRAMHKLSARRVETIKAPGWHGDGGGLWLRIDNSGSRKWVFAWEGSKRRREMGLGAASEITLTTTRELAAEARALLAQGLDPIEERRTKDLEQETPGVTDDAVEEISSVPTFGQFADTYIDAHEDGWKNPKHRQQWRNTIKTHAKSLLNKPIDAITSDDVVAVLRPIWRKVPETAGRLRGRIENILDAAEASIPALSKTIGA